MRLWVVTVNLGRKWEHEHSHDPSRKVTGGRCPAWAGSLSCSDVTGAHHSTLVRGETLEQARHEATLLIHIAPPWRFTRFEEVEIS